MDLNGDMARRVTVDTAALPWSASPSPGVWRKRLHLVGDTESGQVTSLVRFDPGAGFPTHDHPGGEEILVLEGVFNDQQGDWPAGSYLVNPEGFRHAPWSRDGCTLFVKLQQEAPADEEDAPTIAIDTQALAWTPSGVTGIERKLLAGAPENQASTRLELWAPATRIESWRHPRGAEILVLEGSFEDDQGVYAEGSWLRLPTGAVHAPRTATGCRLLVKQGAVADLRPTTDWATDRGHPEALDR